LFEGGTRRDGGNRCGRRRRGTGARCGAKCDKRDQ
jgi:hypothetical protein